MPKKTLAAALAAIVLLPLLVFVDPPAADAHPKTKTVRRCAYDPFAGNQCWNETVSVRHYHTPVQRNLPEPCPAGTTGTPPNCLPIPSDNSRRVTPTTAAPTTTTTEPPKCPAGYIGSPPNCKIPPPPCPWPSHSHGRTCHGPHIAPCGTGTWSAGHGHSPVQRQPCSTTTTTTTTTTEPPECRRQYAAGYGVVDHHRHMLAGHMTGCHPAIANSHCKDGWHAHTHAGSCHRTTVNGTSHSHCPRGHHQHKHGDSNCHHKATQHCEAGEHSHGPGKPCHKSSLHPYIHEECSYGEHNHRGLVFPEIRGCHNENTQHNTGDLTRTEEFVFDLTGDILCSAAGAGVGKVVKLIQKGASWVRKFLSGSGAEIGTEIGCGALYDKLVTEETRQDEAEKKQKHNELDDDEGTQPTPTTAPPADDPIPERPNTAQWAKEWLRYQNAKDKAEARKRWDQVQCNYHRGRGRTGYCR